MNNVQPLNHCAKGHACCAHHLGPPFHIFELDTPNVFEGPKWKCNNLCIFRILYGWLLGCLYGPVINSVFGRWCQKRSSREGKTRGSGTKKRRSHKWFHMIFSCTDPCKDPCTDTFCTSSPLPLKNPQGIANLKKAICVVQSDSIMGVTL